jgi:hypothetical protein
MYSEFLDTEWYYDTVPVPRLKYKMLPTDLVMGLAQPSRVRTILTTDKLIFDDLRPSIAHYGIQTPLVLKVDGSGRITLFDGHHRIIVCSEQGIREVPVVFQICKSLSLESKPISEVLLQLL